jgi:predicted enzyme related to lactoylglutathione lyase
MNPVVHFEMPAENMQRIADFYSKVFGWQPQMMDEEMGNYVVVTTSEADDNGRPKMPGTIKRRFLSKT